MNFDRAKAVFAALTPLPSLGWMACAQPLRLGSSQETEFKAR